jgi:large subunit ribosomal protein L2
MKVAKIQYIFAKPVTNGIRHLKRIKTNLPKQTFKIKSLQSYFHKQNGRCKINGTITVRHRGGGVKQLYRHVVLKQPNFDRKSVILSTCYDPYRSAYINLNYDFLNKKHYFDLAAQESYVGNIIANMDNIETYVSGYRAQLKSLPVGSIVHNITSGAQKKSKYIRSAGTYGTILNINADEKLATIKLPSRAIIKIS